MNTELHAMLALNPYRPPQHVDSYTRSERAKKAIAGLAVFGTFAAVMAGMVSVLA